LSRRAFDRGISVETLGPMGTLVLAIEDGVKIETIALLTTYIVIQSKTRRRMAEL
jgi:hypothetical protein